ncbi:MAG: hypothetical protein ABEJ88_10385 [Halobacterium sp.]
MTAKAVRVHKDDIVLYVTRLETDAGRRIVYEQDPESFETERRTLRPLRARTLARKGKEVPLGETPAWCDPQAPRPAPSPTAP